MPHKFNADQRDKIPKQKHGVQRKPATLRANKREAIEWPNCLF
jgi:hypothetical protein